MAIKQKTWGAVLGFGMAVVLNNSVWAVEAKPGAMPPVAHKSAQEGQACHADLLKQRMAKLHDALKLSAEQEGAWTNFLAGMKPADMQHEHEEFAQTDAHPMSTPDRLDRMAEHMKAHQLKMAEHAAQVRTFYDTLTTEQKSIFDRHFMEHHLGGMPPR